MSGIETSISFLAHITLFLALLTFFCDNLESHLFRVRRCHHFFVHQRFRQLIVLKESLHLLLHGSHNHLQQDSTMCRLEVSTWGELLRAALP